MRWWAMTAMAMVAMGGTAVAAQIVTSSDQIRDGVILARDIQDKTLTARQVRDGGLEAASLSAAARRALRGSVGPRGPRGRRGPAGPVPAADYVTATGTAPAGGVASTKAACRGGLLPLGGGIRDGSNKLVLSSSYPAASRKAGPGWVIVVVNPDAAPHPFTAYAVCARLS
jgi:hypothetical protein